MACFFGRITNTAFSIVCLFTAIVLITSCDSTENKGHKGISHNNTSSETDLAIGDTLFKKALYDSAYFYYKKVAEKAEKEGNHKALTDIYIKIADLHRLNGNLDTALSVILKAEKLVLKSNNPDQKVLSEILHKKGLFLNNKGYFDSAISVLNQSIKIRETLFGLNDTSLALNYNLLGISNFYKGDYENAMKNYMKAYNIALKKKEPEDADLAMIVQNIAIINAQKGEYEKAEKSFTQSLRINEKLLKEDDPELAMINLNVGRLKALLNKEVEALDFYNVAENILLKRPGLEHPYLKYVYQNKGQTYVHIADYEKALVYFNKALAGATATLEEKHPIILSLNMNIGYVYEKKKDYKNALRYYLASIPDQPDNPALIKTYGNLASLYSEMNERQKADKYYRKALNLAESLLGKEHPETGLLYTRYGYFLMTDRSRSDQIEYFDKALAISKKNYGKKSREVSNNYTHIGNYYLLKKQIEKSLENYQEAIISILKDFQDKNINSNPDIKTIEPDRYLVNALNGKAEALAKKGENNNLILSLNTFKLSVQVIDKLRSTYQDEESKLLISEEEKSTFQKTVGIATLLFKQTNDKKYLEEAFQYSDKSKSAVLINSMRDMHAQHFGKIPDKVLQLEKQLKLNIGTFRRFIYEERQKMNPDQNKINEWESRVFAFTVSYDSLTGSLENNYPEYYKLKYSEPNVSISSIQKSLEPDRVLIEYMLSDTALYTFAIDKKSFNLFTQPVDSSLYNEIKTLVSTTNSNSLGNTNESDYINYSKAAYNLYNKLIKPVRTKFSEKKLVIIPDGELGYISFDMLLTSLPDTTFMDYRKLPYLIRDNIVSYSTSAILQYSGFQQKERHATRNFLAMAPSYDNLTVNKTSFTDENGQKVYLLPIPGVEEEMKGIQNSLLATKVRGEKATEKRFKKEVGKYNVLHLAMHTLVNNSQPMLSKLVFYQDNDTVEDGMLNTYELFSMDLNAGLAVLSACNTGSGKLQRGEGIMNLARGFIFAGVPGIVMTMWSVDDQSSARIVKKFYQYLEDGMSKDEALRQAKLDLLAEGDPLRSHPFYWAAYVNIGDNSPMKFRS
ncbi:MAG: CHAT domain-containing protein, partial [Chloroflexota bacterium]